MFGQWSILGNAGTNPAVNFVGTTDNQALRFRTNNIARMAILGNGRVGIGLNAPTDRLHVQGGGIKVEHNAFPMLSLIGTGNSNIGLSLYQNAANMGGMWYNPNTSRLWLTTLAAGTRPDFVMRGDNGFLGLGIADPYARFDVYNATSPVGIKSNTQVSDDTTIVAVQGLANNTMAGQKAIGGEFYSNATASGQASGVEGRAGAALISTGVYGSAISSGSTSTAYGVYGAASGLGINWAGYFSGRGYFSDRVGIGTVPGATPSAQLHVVSENLFIGGRIDATAPVGSSIAAEMLGLRVSSTTSYSPYAVGGDFTATNSHASGVGIGVRGMGDGGGYGVWGEATSIASNAGIGVYGKSTGVGTNWGGYFVGRGYFSERVGIGTSSPLARLHVDSDSTENGLRVQIDGATKLMVHSNGGVSVGSPTSTDNNGLYVAGNVGIGISNPTTKLHVNETGGATPFAIQISGVSKLKTNTNGSTSVGTTSTGPTNGLIVSGNVQLGSVAVPAGYRMAVDGKIICEELKVQLSGSWPDYVFADGYELMPLAQVQQYIDQNKHLPGVPSAATVSEEGGVEVGEMQRVLLQKMEELTLYMLQLQAQNEALRAEIEALKQK